MMQTFVGLAMKCRILPAALLAAVGLIVGCDSSHRAQSDSPERAEKGTPGAGNRPAEVPKPEPDRVHLETNSPQIRAIALEPAQSRKASSTRFTGRLTWNDEVTVRVFSPIGGRVEAVPGQLGHAVQAGEILARIASPDLGQAQADLRKAESDLQLAERNLARARDLFEHGATPKKEVDFAEGAQASAQSEKERASARLTHYGGRDGRIDQEYLLKSPLAGVVVEKNLSAGQEVRPDQMLANAPNLFAPLFVVSNPKKLWLYLDVTELDIAGLAEGMPVKVNTRAYPNRTFDGTIDFVGSSLDPATRTIRLRAQIENPEKLLRAEMYVTAEVTLNSVAGTGESSGAVAENGAGVDIPAKAVFLQDNRPNVFVETAPGSYLRRPVTVGREVDGKVLALTGVTAGERVVTDGCLLLQSMLRNQE